MLKAALAAVAILATLSASGAPGAEPEDVLFLRTSGGIVLVRTGAETAVVNFPGAVPSTDWSSVVRTTVAEGNTRVIASDAATGSELWSRELPGRLEVKVASPGAGNVALLSRQQANGYARSSTSFVILGDRASEPRTIELDGNYQPEAFSTDGQSLFVVEYLPPLRPDRYRVRRLDLRTEEVVGVYTVDLDLQKAMQGTARVQAASPDGRHLYTLYTVEGPDGVRRAFVHVLSLDELWAHCVDLPTSFAAAPEKAIGIAVAPDGDHVYAADTSSGTIAEIDTEALSVTRTAEAEIGASGGLAHVAAGPDGTIYVARGTRLLALDAAGLASRGSWEMQEDVRGIQPARDGRRVYVGLKGRIVILDTTTGQRLGLEPPDIEETIDQLGQETRPFDVARTVIECAC